MSTPVVVPLFGPQGEPFTLDALNEALAAIVAAVNALAGEPVLQLGITPGNQPGYMPITGGTFLGQIQAPSVLIGPNGGPLNEAIDAGDLATTAIAGIVKMAAAIADLGQTISNPPTQAEVQAITDKIDGLLAALRTAGSLSP